MIGVFWGYVFFFGLFLGGLIGWGASKASSKLDDGSEQNIDFTKYVPSKEEVLCVLRTIQAMYRCSPHEDDCMEEAIRLIESMPEEDEDGE